MAPYLNNMEKGVMKIVLPKLIGIFIFVLFLALLNFLIKFISWNLFVSFVNFFNMNAFLLIGIGVVFMFAELISKMEFPSNVFGPILNFIGTWMLLYFLFNFVEAINRRLNFEFLEKIILIKTPILIAILSLVFVFGYLPIIYKLLKEMGTEKAASSEKDGVPLVIVEKKIIKEKSKREKRNRKAK
jgi:amino acid transporter